MPGGGLSLATKAAGPVVESLAPPDHQQNGALKMAEQEFTPNAGQVRFAFDFLQDELETLLALSIALKNQLEPDDPDNHDDCEHTTAWRLSQVLNNRLASTEFSNNMRTLMLGSADVCNSPAEVSHA